MLPRFTLPIASLAAITLTGCGLNRWEWGTSLPEPRPLGAGLHTYRPAESPAAAEKVPKMASIPAEPTGELTLRKALSLALARSPALAGFAWSVREAEAEQLQAGLLPNPELEAEYEGFAGTGEFRGTRAAETTIALGQLIELGGKRRKRLKLAEMDSRLAGWDYEAKRIEVLTGVAQRFIGVLAFQQKLELAQKNLKLAEQAFDAVKKRVDAGKAAPTDKAKALVEAATSRIRLRRIERAAKAARHALAATWGSKSPKFERLSGDLGQVASLPSPESLIPRLAQNPAVARWTTELQQRQAAVELAKAQAIPDVTVGVGYQHFRETPDNDHAMLLSVSVPLPVFDRNQGRISKARFGVLKAKVNQHAAEVKVRAELEEAYQALAAARSEAASLSEEVLPAAGSSFNAATESFRLGKTGYLDVLDAQRTLIEAREAYVEALASYHQAVAKVEGLIAQSIEPVETGK